MQQASQHKASFRASVRGHQNTHKFDFKSTKEGYVFDSNNCVYLETDFIYVTPT